uniref:G_PROTEIN_RECEP_F1_2 domain-containing protein n=1 Tax=Bursaphelenchus xylophilus TaxID=6326 RepID=A0A1I7S1M5_BURXY
MTIMNIEDAVELYFSTEFDILHESPSDYNPYVWDVQRNVTDWYTNGHYDSISHLTAIHKVSHTITMIIGGVCSTTLLYLVLYHCQGALEQYRKMLLLCSVCDIGYWLLENMVSVTSVYAQRYLFYCVSVFVGSYGISLILAVKTLRLLAENQEVYGEKTKKMQKQLTLTLALQVRRLF